MKIKEKILNSLNTFPKVSLMIDWCKENLEEEQEVELMVAFIAEKAEFELKDFSHDTFRKLNSAINRSGLVNQELVYETILEFTDIGIISLVKSFIQHEYDGLFFNERASIILDINGVEYESKYMDEKQIEKFKEQVLILFDKECFKKTRAIDKVEALCAIFKTPRMSNYVRGYNSMVNAINKLASYQKAKESGDLREFKKVAYDKVINLYLTYLWECQGNAKELKYIYSFESWVKKNKDLWGEDISTPEESLNLFIEEHKTIINLFNKIEEPGLVWRKGKEKLSSERLLLEIIINGLGGI